MKKLCVGLVIYEDHTRMHGQQNKKKTHLNHTLSSPSASSVQIFRLKFSYALGMSLTIRKRNNPEILVRI